MPSQSNCSIQKRSKMSMEYETEALLIKDSWEEPRKSCCPTPVVVTIKVIYTLLLIPIMFFLVTLFHELGHALTGIGFGGKLQFLEVFGIVFLSKSWIILWSRKLDRLLRNDGSIRTDDIQSILVANFHGIRSYLHSFSSIPNSLLDRSMEQLLCEGISTIWMLVVYGIILSHYANYRTSRICSGWT